jgi:hypothetical protein
MRSMKIHFRLPIPAFSIWSTLCLVTVLAACSSDSGTSNSRLDAASGGLGGTTSSGGTVVGSGGAAGATTSPPSTAGASGRATTSTGTGGRIDAGAGSGGVTGVGGGAGAVARDGGPALGGQAGLAGTGVDASTGRDVEGTVDVLAATPDAAKDAIPTVDVADDVAGADALSAAAQEYVKTFAEPYCTRLAECCKQQGFETSGLAACEQNELAYVKHLDDGSAVIDPATIQTILSGLKSSCDQPSYVLLGGTTKGTRAVGAACDDAAQCAGMPILCLAPEGSSAGKCTTPPKGKAGDGCAVTCDDATTCGWTTSGGKSPYAVCYDQDGLRCDSVSFTCVSVTKVGAACSDFTECGEHAECSNGTCQAKLKVGATCGAGPSCDSGLQCRSNGGTGYTCQTLSIAWSGSCSP